MSNVLSTLSPVCIGPNYGKWHAYEKKKTGPKWQSGFCRLSTKSTVLNITLLPASIGLYRSWLVNSSSSSHWAPPPQHQTPPHTCSFSLFLPATTHFHHNFDLYTYCIQKHFQFFCLFSPFNNRCTTRMIRHISRPQTKFPDSSLTLQVSGNHKFSCSCDRCLMDNNGVAV